MLDSGNLGDEILEVGITFRVRREGEGLLLDGSEHVRYGVALEGQTAPHPHKQTHPRRPHIHLSSHAPHPQHKCCMETLLQSISDTPTILCPLVVRCGSPVDGWLLAC